MSLDRLLDDFEAGHISREKLKEELLRQTFIETGSAKIDQFRELRTGGPEVVYCAGKTPDQVASIFDHLNRLNGRGLGTKADQTHYQAAGMEGALPSVIGGMVLPPVVAVPTSVGYGANFQGLAALLTMMNSCAPGIGVVNIDNGFGAGYLAHKINMLAVDKQDGVS